MDAVSKFALFFYAYIYIVILTFCCICIYIYIQNKTKHRMSGFCVLLFGTMVYNEILSLESLGIYYPEKDLQESLLPSKSMKKKKKNNKRSASFSMLEETKDGGGNDDGDQNTEIVADDWFSPKLSHYQTKA